MFAWRCKTWVNPFNMKFVFSRLNYFSCDLAKFSSFIVFFLIMALCCVSSTLSVTSKLIRYGCHIKFDFYRSLKESMNFLYFRFTYFSIKISVIPILKWEFMRRNFFASPSATFSEKSWTNAFSLILSRVGLTIKNASKLIRRLRNHQTRESSQTHRHAFLSTLLPW